MLEPAKSKYNPFGKFAETSPMARMILDFDWESTEMGPIETWDPALITSLRTILGCPISICITWGPERRYFYNDAYVPILQQRHPQALGSTMQKVWSEIWDQVLALSLKVDAGGFVHEADLQFNIEVEGRIQENFFTFAYSPLYSSAGLVAGMMCTIIDTTSVVVRARRSNKTEEDLARAMIAMETERAKLRTVLEQSPMAIAVLDGPTHVFSFANQLYRTLFVGGRDVAGQPLNEILPEAQAQGYVDLLDGVYRTGERVIAKEAEFTFATPSGPQRKFVDFVYEPIRGVGGEIEGILAAINDVTERVIAVKEIDSARREAEVANAAKSAFLANMSHEIRTPLGAILGFTDVLKTSGVDTPEREKYLDIISRNGHALIRIIDDILDLSKIEAGKLDIETAPVDLRRLLADVISMFNDRARGKGIALTYDLSGLPSVNVMSDAARIRQIIVNLIGNAIKFTSAGGVTVSARTVRAEDGWLDIVFSIRDTGIGMTKEDSLRLFRPFTQADTTNTRRYGGTGLGLALSRNLAGALGGSVDIVECELNKGCVFEFSFIAREAVSAESAQGLASSQPSSRKILDGVRVLVVDDSPDNRHLVDIYLRKHGAIVSQASDGREGIEAARKQTYDIVLMDIQMPGLDGYGVLAEMRRLGLKMPVIALTAHAMKEEKNRTLAAGFVDHVTKPIQSATLVSAIAEHIRSH